jgi:transcriptional regulator with XRE-family HTH domain
MSSMALSDFPGGRCGMVYEVLHLCSVRETMGAQEEHHMDEKHAKRLGALIKDQRLKLGIGLREAGRRTGIDDGLLSRMESGAILTPAPDKLARIAEVLNINLSDLYAMADYAVPTDLPSPALYLRTKFRGDLPASAMKSLTRELDQLLAKHGLDPAAGPTPGEDETPVAPTPRPKTTKTRTTKGGKP